jgi:ribonuclease BN (tRNA processing enzyme)
MAPVWVSFLGAGDAFCAKGRHQAAYLVQAEGASFLLDCGVTTLASLQRTPSLIPAIDTILISHLHGDHFAGIPFLLLHYTHDRPRRRPLRIAGPPGTEERVWSLFRAMYKDASRQPLPFALEFVEMSPGVPLSIDAIGVEPFRVPHQENEVSLGLKVNVDGRRILYSGDTGWTEELVTRSQDTDLFICECCFFETRLSFHLDYPRLAEHKERFGSRRLILTHLGREVLERRDQIEIELARDGLIVGV